jgi:glycosyltransferase involved in cell wall biosynthesis
VKILHLITGLDIGGAEMMLFRLCKQQYLAGDEPVVISLKSEGKLKALFEEEKIKVVELGFPKGRFSATGFKLLVQQIKQVQPEIVHCWMYHANIVGSFASLFVKSVPVIWAIHNTTLSKTNSSSLTILIMRIAGLLSFLPKKIVYCSEIAKKLHENFLYSKKRGLFIPNGVDINLFSPNINSRIDILNSLGIEKNQFVVGIIGRFDPQKDYRNFVEAANHLLQYRDDVHFVMCGPGVDSSNPELTTWITQTKAGIHFHLLGAQMNIERIHNSFDVFVSSSAYGEAFPIVLAEAMACGVPCVATDIGDAAYIVADTGHVVPVKDSQAIADAVDAILSLSEGERKQLKQSARSRIVENFSLDKIAQLYKDTYEEVSSMK